MCSDGAKCDKLQHECMTIKVIHLIPQSFTMATTYLLTNVWLSISGDGGPVIHAVIKLDTRHPAM